MKNKITLITIVFTLLLITISLVWFVFLNSPQNTSDQNIRTKITDFFPEIPFFNNKEGVTNQNPSLPSLDSNSNLINENNNYNLKIKGLIKIESESETEPRIFGVESETGHVYEISTQKTEVTKVTNTTVKNIDEVVFGHNNNNLFVYYKTNNPQSKYSYLKIPLEVPDENIGTTTTQSDSINLIPLYNIEKIIPSPNEPRLFVLEKLNNKLIGYISTLDFQNKNSIINTPYKSWFVEWLNPDQLILTSSPSINLFGYSYVLNINTGIMTKTVGFKKGLTVLAKYSDNKIIYSENKNGRVVSFIKNTNNTNSPEIPISSQIIPEKCLSIYLDSPEILCSVLVNNPQTFTNYPDSYLKGITRANKALVSINTNDGSYETFLGTNQNQNIDKIVAVTEKIIFFTEKNNELRSIFSD